MFSGDENYGRYLDLNEIFELYINLEHVPKVNSLKYLSTIDRFHEIPLKAKKHPNYGRFAAHLFLGCNHSILTCCEDIYELYLPT